jgi:hypothetical protein
MDTSNSEAVLAATHQRDCEDGECGAAVLLEQEKKFFENAVRLLEESNVELRKALNEEPNEIVYKDAIGVGQPIMLVC